MQMCLVYWIGNHFGLWLPVNFQLGFATLLLAHITFDIPYVILSVMPCLRQLDRNLSNKRIFPAVNIVASSTRRDDLLQDKQTLDRMWILRKYLADMNPIEAMDFVKDRMEKTKDNDEFLMSMNS